MLNERGIAHTYREYTQDPLTAREIRDLLQKLGMRPGQVLRSRDAAKAGLSGDEADDALIEAMVGNPRLLQRPIGIVGERAALGRPPENLLALVAP